MSESPHIAAPGHLYFERERGVYDVTITRDLAHVVVGISAADGRAAQVSAVFAALASAAIPVFLIKLHSGAVTFCVEGGAADNVEQALSAVGFPCRTLRGLAIIGVLASSMRDLTGVMIKIADALQQAGARMYGAGDSHSSVQCLIDGNRADQAIVQIRAAFGLGADHG